MHKSTTMMELCNKIAEATEALTINPTESDREALRWAIGRAKAKAMTAGRYMVWWHSRKNTWVVFKFESTEEVKAIAKPEGFRVARFLEKQREARAIAKAVVAPEPVEEPAPAPKKKRAPRKKADLS